MRMTSLQGRLALVLLLSAVGSVLIYLGVTQWPLPALLRDMAASPAAVSPQRAWVTTPLGGSLVTALLMVPLLVWLSGRVIQPLERMLRALEGSVASYRDGDFSFSIAVRRNDALGDLQRMHNALGQTLREQRQQLVQRELLLETVVQHTPVALLLVDRMDHVTYANVAARHLFNEGRALAGEKFTAVLQRLPETLQVAVGSGEDTLFSVDMDGSEEMFHVSQRLFRLQGRPHRLYLLRRMTRELARQEVATWKRVIRVISHELNNSLAPISSLAHSGAELVRRGDLERLPAVFEGIGDRARHLHTFISGYAGFAKLPTPRLEDVEWAPFLKALALQCRFRLLSDVGGKCARMDPAQIEQVLINLIKNAHESGSAADEVCMRIRHIGGRWRIDVLDRGPGVSEAVWEQALLPFYSTKRSGTGLGLALTREIVEAHDGRMVLANREHGGLRVSLWLPDRKT